MSFWPFVNQAPFYVFGSYLPFGQHEKAFGAALTRGRRPTACMAQFQKTGAVPKRALTEGTPRLRWMDATSGNCLHHSSQDGKGQAGTGRKRRGCSQGSTADGRTTASGLDLDSGDFRHMPTLGIVHEHKLAGP